MGNITGRDGFILVDALTTALVALERLPKEQQPQSNMDDMRALLASLCCHGPTLSIMLAQAKCRLFPELDPLKVYLRVWN